MSLPRPSGTLDLAESSSDDVFCHRLTTAASDGALIVRSPNEYGDRMLQTAIRGGLAIPAPDTGSAASELCGYGGQVFIKVGSQQARARHDRNPESHQLACRGRACVMSFFGLDGVAVIPFKLD